MEKKGLRVNTGKTKIMICSTGLALLQSSGNISMCRLSHWNGQQQHLQWLQALGHKKCTSVWQRTLTTDVHSARELHAPWMNCTSLGWQTTEGSPSVRPEKLEVVASFCYLGDMLSAAGGCALSTTTCVKTAWKKFKYLLPVLSSSHFSSKTCGLCAERNAPRQWDLAIDKAKPPASAAKWQGNDQTDLQC